MCQLYHYFTISCIKLKFNIYSHIIIILVKKLITILLPEFEPKKYVLIQNRQLFFSFLPGKAGGRHSPGQHCRPSNPAFAALKE